MACIIADAGPLIAFAKIHRLDILHSLFARIQITDSVREECMAKASHDAALINQAILGGWIISNSSSEPSMRLPRSLGLGESDSIRLARLNIQESLLIVDDRLARREALHLKLNITGTVRLLVLAEKKNLISSAESLIAEMRVAGYRISPKLLEIVRNGCR